MKPLDLNSEEERELDKHLLYKPLREDCFQHQAQKAPSSPRFTLFKKTLIPLFWLFALTVSLLHPNVFDTSSFAKNLEAGLPRPNHLASLTSHLSPREKAFALATPTQPYQNEAERYLNLFQDFPEEFGFYELYTVKSDSLPEDFAEMAEKHDPENAYYPLYLNYKLIQKALNKSAISPAAPDLSKYSYSATDLKLLDQIEASFLNLSGKQNLGPRAEELASRRFKLFQKPQNLAQQTSLIFLRVSEPLHSAIPLLKIIEYHAFRIQDSLSKENLSQAEYYAQRGLSYIKFENSNSLIPFLINLGAYLEIYTQLHDIYQHFGEIEKRDATLKKIQALEQLRNQTALPPHHYTQRESGIFFKLGYYASAFTGAPIPKQQEVRITLYKWTAYFFDLLARIFIILLVMAYCLHLFGKRRTPLLFRKIAPMLQPPAKHRLTSFLFTFCLPIFFITTIYFLTPLGRRTIAPWSDQGIPFAFFCIGIFTVFLTSSFYSEDRIAASYFKDQKPSSLLRWAYFLSFLLIPLSGLIEPFSDSLLALIPAGIILFLIMTILMTKGIRYLSRQDRLLLDAIVNHRLPNAWVKLALFFLFMSPLFSLASQYWVKKDILLSSNHSYGNTFYYEAQITQFLVQRAIGITHGETPE